MSKVITLNPSHNVQGETMAQSDALRQAIAALLQIGGVSQKQVATEAGVGQARLSQFLAGKYTGDNDSIARALERWLSQRERKSEQAKTLPDAPAFVFTPTANRVFDALTYAQLAGDIAVVYGGAGVGKTITSNHYAAQENNVWVATLTPSSRTVSGVLEEISIAVGVKNPSQRAVSARRDIVERIRNTGGLLIIDEAQHANIDALDEIRSLYDAGGDIVNHYIDGCGIKRVGQNGVGIALVGNEAVYGRMTGGNRAAYLDRLFSRIGKRTKVAKVLKSDVESLAAAWGIADSATIDLLVAIGNKPGALRGVTKTLRLASMFAAGAGAPLNATHVKAAYADLGGAE